MTNGEKIQTILDIDKDCTEVYGKNGMMTFSVPQDWWNAEYKEPTSKNDLTVDCISRQALLNATVKKSSIWNHITNSEGDNLETIISKLSPVTPQPRKGHWEHGRELSRAFMGDVLKGINYEDWHCSNCHCVVEQSIKPEWNYCPHCGSDMRGEKE